MSRRSGSSKEDMQMASKYTKRCSTSLIIRKMQIKTTMRCHLIPIIRSISKRQEMYWQRCGEKGTLVRCWWECKLVQPLWKIIGRFFKKLKVALPYNQPSNSTSGYLFI